VSPSLGVQFGTLARRSIARTVRQPFLIVPTLVFPLFMLAVLSGNGGQITRVKGFPTHSYLTFVLGATFIQCATGATTMAGNAAGEDIETGFLNRLALTPMREAVLVSAQLAGVAVLGTIQGIVILLVGLAAGAHVQAGVGGALVLILVIALIVTAFGAIGLFVAVRTGSAREVQALAVLGLGLLFMSSMVMPRNLIKADWFKAIATYNPFSYLVEATRSLLITGWDGQALALGCGFAAIGLVVALSAAVLSFRGRMSRT
jgi:ABC-2 type transport system permease protein